MLRDSRVTAAKDQSKKYQRRLAASLSDNVHYDSQSGISKR